MKVFLAATSFQPVYGGPAFSVSGLATALAEAGVKVTLWASDQSALISPLLSVESSIQRLIGTEADALYHAGKIDIMHDNGIWLPHNHRLAVLAIRRKIPRIVSPRGMLEPWAWKHKQWKKQAAWWLYQRADLKKAQCIHATAQEEAVNVERLGLGVPISVVPNGVDVPKIHSEFADASDGKECRDGQKKTALFLSRVHPKKGLAMLIEAWKRVLPENWLLQIAGPDEAGHQAQLEKTVLAAGLSNVISFLGPVDGERKKSAFLNADLFVLPTYSENFGIVVAEALAHGIPVLTTTGAPWSMLLEYDCGWWVDPTIDEITKGLRLATSCDKMRLQAMGAEGRKWVRTEFGWARIAREFIATYEKLLADSFSSAKSC